MSGFVTRQGIFVAPCYVTATPGGAAEDTIMTGPIEQWTMAPANEGRTTTVRTYYPPRKPLVYDVNDNVVGGGEPAVGAMLAIITARGATGVEAEDVLREIDALPDVRRYIPAHTTTVWQGIETWLRSKGLTTVYLVDGGANGRDGVAITEPDLRMQELAARTCVLIDPTFGSFDPGAFG